MEHLQANDVGFTVVDRGWDPAEVLTFITELQSGPGRDGPLQAGRRVPPPTRGAESVIAEAEHDADEIRQRAVQEASQLRVRTADDARAAYIAALRDHLFLTRSSRLLADEIIQSAREQEAGVYDRVRSLRSVVHRTEKLLRSVVSARNAPAAEQTHRLATSTDDDVHIVVATNGEEQAEKLDRGRGSGALPESVRKLLDDLRAGSADVA
jgi:hypothetical protein